MFLLYHVLFSSQICKAFLGLETGHKVQGGGGGVSYENFFFKYWFSVAHPRIIWQNWGGPPLEWHRKN